MKKISFFIISLVFFIACISCNDPNEKKESLTLEEKPGNCRVALQKMLEEFEMKYPTERKRAALEKSLKKNDYLNAVRFRIELRNHLKENSETIKNIKSEISSLTTKYIDKNACDVRDLGEEKRQSPLSRLDRAFSFYFQDPDDKYFDTYTDGRLDTCCFQNYIKRSSLMRSENPIKFTGNYMQWACGHGTPQVMPKFSGTPPVSLQEMHLGLKFFVPEGMKSPDELLGGRNSYEIKGFYYYIMVDGKRYMLPHFDLIAWRPEIPYVLYKTDKNNDVYTVDIKKPMLKYWNWKTDEKTVFKKAGRYRGCGI